MIFKPGKLYKTTGQVVAHDAHGGNIYYLGVNKVMMHVRTKPAHIAYFLYKDKEVFINMSTHFLNYSNLVEV